MANLLRELRVSDVLGPRGNPTGGPPPYQWFADCVARLGESGTISGSTLTIELPAPRNPSDIVNCGTYDSPIEMPLTAERADAFMSEFVGASTGSVPMPTLTATGTGAAPTLVCLWVRPSDGVRRCTLEIGVAPLVCIPSATLRSIRGTQTQTLRLSLAGTTETLSLVVRAP